MYAPIDRHGKKTVGTSFGKFLGCGKKTPQQQDTLVTDYKTKAQIAKVTPILDKLPEFKRSWTQHVNTMPRNRLPRFNETLIPNWQKESWQTFEETSGYVRPERVTKWPSSMRYNDDDDDEKLRKSRRRRLEFKRSWTQHVNRMLRNRLPRVMKHYCPTGRRNHGRPLKRLLDT